MEKEEAIIITMIGKTTCTVAVVMTMKTTMMMLSNHLPTRKQERASKPWQVDSSRHKGNEGENRKKEYHYYRIILDSLSFYYDFIKGF